MPFTYSDIAFKGIRDINLELISRCLTVGMFSPYDKEYFEKDSSGDPLLPATYYVSESDNATNSFDSTRGILKRMKNYCIEKTTLRNGFYRLIPHYSKKIDEWVPYTTADYNEIFNYNPADSVFSAEKMLKVFNFLDNCRAGKLPFILGWANHWSGRTGINGERYSGYIDDQWDSYMTWPRQVPRFIFAQIPTTVNWELDREITNDELEPYNEFCILKGKKRFITNKQ